MAAAGIGQSLGTRALTAWEQTRAARNRRTATQRFLDGAAIANATFTRAFTNQTGGIVKLAAIAALDRLDTASMNRLTLTNLIAAAQTDVDLSVAPASTASSILDLQV